MGRLCKKLNVPEQSTCAATLVGEGLDGSREGAGWPVQKLSDEHHVCTRMIKKVPVFVPTD